MPEDSGYIGKNLNITGIVTEIKTYEVPFGEKGYRLKLRTELKKISSTFVKVKKSCLFSGCGLNINLDSDDAVENILIGRKVKCKGRFEDFEEVVNQGQFDTKSYYNNEGISGVLRADKISFADGGGFFSPEVFLYRLNNAVSQKYLKILDSKNAGSLSAMVLGDKSGLDEEIKELYQENSISHLLSISGLHISLVGGAVYLFLKKLRVSYIFPFILAGLILFLYGLFTGFSVSTARAVLMMIVFFASFIIGKSYDLPSGLAFSALIIILINHRTIYQSGFQLSFLAVVGIFYVMPEFLYIFKVNRLNKDGIAKLFYIFITSIICSLSVMISTLPIILVNFYEISLAGIVLNIIVIPLMSIVVISGLIGGFLALLSEMTGRVILGVSYYTLNFYTFLCKLCDNFTSLRLILGKPEKFQIFIYYTSLTILIYYLHRKRRSERIESLKLSHTKTSHMLKRQIISLITVCLICVILSARNKEFSINMLDIGQGDCFVINDGKNNIFISDCGSTTIDRVGKVRLLPFLKAKGWGRIDTIFVSHMDKDHVNGVNDLLKCREIEVKRVVISVSYKSDKLNCTELEQLKNLVAERGIGLFYIKKGDEIKNEMISFKCIYPKGNENIEDQNEASIVMRMDYKGLSALFTGDIASKTEEEVIRYTDKEILNCDILKVCHHGSKNSSSEEFLGKVDPKYYLISCGLMNRYGHPHKSSLERMEKEGGKIFRTDHMGGVELRIKDEKLVIKYRSKNLSGKKFIPAKECDCEDCKRIKINTHLK